MTSRSTGDPAGFRWVRLLYFIHSEVTSTDEEITTIVIMSLRDSDCVWNTDCSGAQ